jgi:hypothetical protein
MKDRFGSDVRVGDMVATDVMKGPWLYAKVIRLPENDDTLCEVQFTDVNYDDDGWESLFAEDIILCTNIEPELYTVVTTINGIPTDCISCELEIEARSYNQAVCILKDIIKYP